MLLLSYSSPNINVWLVLQFWYPRVLGSLIPLLMLIIYQPNTGCVPALVAAHESFPAIHFGVNEVEIHSRLLSAVISCQHQHSKRSIHSLHSRSLLATHEFTAFGKQLGWCPPLIHVRHLERHFNIKLHVQTNEPLAHNKSLFLYGHTTRIRALRNQPTSMKEQCKFIIVLNLHIFQSRRTIFQWHGSIA